MSFITVRRKGNEKKYLSNKLLSHSTRINRSVKIPVEYFNSFKSTRKIVSPWKTKCYFYAQSGFLTWKRFQ